MKIQNYHQAHLRCEACGAITDEIHHIRTRGAGGTDEPENLIALCGMCHHEVHRIGRDTFATKYGIERMAALPCSREVFA